MTHKNIPFFIPHLGCPCRCSFCNQRVISGKAETPSTDEIYRVCKLAYDSYKDRSNIEIAFFGGSFTAIPRETMISYLRCVQDFLGDGGFRGIRVSTRPDAIDDEILTILKQYGVTSVELGAQSISDEVLLANNRGHTAVDVIKASKLIHSYGIGLGLQMMTGLYKSTLAEDYKTAEAFLRLSPETVRIYPTAILKGTDLEKLYINGSYPLVSMEEMAELCSRLLLLFEEHKIPVIRLGLHSSEVLESEIAGGYYHPAFRELCENVIFRKLIAEKTAVGGSYTVFVPKGSISKAAGHKKSNIEYFKKQKIFLKLKESDKLSGYQILATEEV